MATIDPAVFNPRYADKSKDSKASADEKEAAREMVLAEGEMLEDKIFDAVNSAGKALDKFRSLKDLRGAADATRILCRGLIHEGKRKEANKLAKDEKDKCKGEPLAEATMLLAIAEANSERRGEKNRVLAVEACKEAETTFKGKGEKRMQGQALMALANLYVRQKTDVEKSVEDALQAGRAAASLFREADDKCGQAMASHSISSACVKGLKYAPSIPNLADECMEAGKVAVACFSAVGLEKMKAFAMVSLARLEIEAADKPAKAVAAAAQALKFCRSTSSSQECAAVCVMVEAYIALSKKDKSAAGKSKMSNKAEKTATDAIEKFKASGDKSAEAQCWHALAMAQMSSGRQDAALSSAEKCAESFKEAKDSEGEIGALQLVSQLSLKSKSNAGQARKAAEQVQKMSKGAMEQIKAMKAIFNSEMLAQDYTKAKSTAKKLIELTKEAPAQQASAKQCLCQAQFYDQEFKNAIATGQDVMNLYNTIGDLTEEGKILMTLADIHVAAQEYEAALRDASKSKQILRQAEEKELEGDASFLSAQIQLTIMQHGIGFNDTNFEEFYNKFTDFQESVNSAKTIGIELGKPVLQASAICLLSQAYTYIEQIVPALKAAKEAANIFKDLEDDVNLAHVMVIEADAWHAGGQKPKAKEVCKAALKIFKEFGDARGEAVATVAMERIDPPKPPEAPKPAKQDSWWNEDWDWEAGAGISLAEFVQLPENKGKSEDQMFQDYLQQSGKDLDAALKEAEALKAKQGGGAAAAPAADTQLTAYTKKAVGTIDMSNINEDLLRDKLYDIVQSTVGYEIEDLDDDMPLMQAGIASRQAVTLRAELMDEFDGISFPATMVFDFPTIASLKDYVIENA